MAARPTRWISAAAGFVVVLLLGGAGVLAQRTAPPSAAPPSAVPGATLVVLARLVDMPTGMPHCGMLSVIASMRYEVVAVLRGRYRSTRLYATHLCPEMSRRMAAGPTAGTLESFRLGELHRLWLRPVPARSRQGIFDRYGDDDLPRFETLRADLERVPVRRPH